MDNRFLIDTQIISALIGIAGALLILILSVTGYFFKKLYDHITEHLNLNKTDNDLLREELKTNLDEISKIKSDSNFCKHSRIREIEDIGETVGKHYLEQKQEFNKVNQKTINLEQSIKKLSDDFKGLDEKFTNKFQELKDLILDSKRTNKDSK